MRFDTPDSGVWDAIIVGQGLAGTTLAWRLIEAGQTVLVIDGDPPVTCSRIAAGLITPITGQRMVIAEGLGAYLAEARAYYRGIEARTGAAFFNDRRAVRLFQNEAERAAWAKRRSRPEYEAFLLPADEPLADTAICDTSGGGFAFTGAQLDVAAYLDASRGQFAFARHEVNWDRDVVLSADEVAVCGVRGRRVFACEGYAAARNPYFSWVPFNAAKGDILTVRFHERVPPECFHRGIWIAPTREPDVFRAGSTYDWEAFDCVPDPVGRAAIEAKLRAFWRVPYTVLDHEAAVRPVISVSKPKMGWHPEYERLGYFNGLGSKGSLMAPWFAAEFARAIVDGAPLPEGADVRAYWR